MRSVEQRSRERGASPIPFVIFLVLWLGAAYWAYVNQQELEKRTAIVNRKKIASLKVSDNVPEIRKRTEQCNVQIRDLKALMGFGPTTEVSGAETPTETVISEANRKLDGYFENTKVKDASAGAFIGRQDAGTGAIELRINNLWIAVPIVGEQVKADKLKDKQYQLNLQNVLIVLLEVHDRLVRHQKNLESVIATKKEELSKLTDEGKNRSAELESGITKTKALIVECQAEKTKFETEYKAKTEAANAERTKLEGEASEYEEQYKRAITVGKREVQSLRNQIIETNRQKANLREQLGSMRVSRETSGVRLSRADLLRSAIETDEPDGEIAYSSSEEGVSLNIGRTHKVIPGLMFFVYSTAPGGGWTYRGKVQVVKILKDDIAQARVIELLDKFNPMSGGDKVFNKVFRTPAEAFNKGPVRLTFIGEFPRHKDNMRYIKRKLEEFGVQVQDKLTHWTEIVIVDDREKRYEQDEDYIRATRDLNVEVMTIDQLNEFIQY